MEEIKWLHCTLCRSGREGAKTLHCTLCRSGREGAKTLQRAHLRNVTWPEPNTSLAGPIQVCVEC